MNLFTHDGCFVTEANVIIPMSLCCFAIMIKSNSEDIKLHMVITKYWKGSFLWITLKATNRHGKKRLSIESPVGARTMRMCS